MKLIRDRGVFVMNQSYESLAMKVASAFSMCYKNKRVTHINLDGDTVKVENSNTHDENVNIISHGIEKDHTSPLEHAHLTAVIWSDCAISRELLRHRHTSFTMESTRYCNYAKNRFGSQITYIAPTWVSDKCVGEFNSYWSIFNAATTIAEFIWLGQLFHAENSYMRLLKRGWTAEKARVVLPLGTKTEYVLTTNVREWKTIFDQRLHGVTGSPHPQVKEIMRQLHESAVKKYPAFFE